MLVGERSTLGQKISASLSLERKKLGGMFWKLHIQILVYYYLFWSLPYTMADWKSLML
jgi:hypothetical protein